MTNPSIAEDQSAAIDSTCPVYSVLLPGGHPGTPLLGPEW